MIPTTFSYLMAAFHKGQIFVVQLHTSDMFVVRNGPEPELVKIQGTDILRWPDLWMRCMVESISSILQRFLKNWVQV